jgi:hypothetical protein
MHQNKAAQTDTFGAMALHSRGECVTSAALSSSSVAVEKDTLLRAYRLIAI